MTGALQGVKVLDLASIWERERVLTLTGCPSIFLGTVSLSNRRKGRK